MAKNLGMLPATGVLSAANQVTPGCWVVSYPTQILPSMGDFEVWHGAIRGPGGYFLVYLDDALFGVGENGSINEYAPPTAMYVRKGQSITLHWSISTGTAPRCWLYLREPEVGQL